MERIKKLLAILFLFVSGVAVGGGSFYYWFKKYWVDEMGSAVSVSLIPGETKEIFLLISIAESLGNVPSTVSKQAICRLIDIKVGQMRHMVQNTAKTSSQATTKALNEYASWHIPTAEQIEQSAHCEKNWLPNITVKRDTPQAARPLP